MCWVTLFIGYPSTLRLEKEPSFNGVEFKSLAEDAGLHLQFSGIQAHSSIGVGEKYHSPLRIVFDKVMDENPRLSRAVVLRLVVKACNDTLDPDGLVPILLVYGALPSLQVATAKIPQQQARMKALDCARREMKQITVERRITRLQVENPSASKYTIRPGSLVRVYCEEAKSWIGRVEVVQVEGKMVRVTDGAKVKQFKLVQLMPLKTGDLDIDNDTDKNL